MNKLTRFFLMIGVIIICGVPTFAGNEANIYRNQINQMVGVTNDGNLYTTLIRVDPSSKALLTQGTVTGAITADLIKINGSVISATNGLYVLPTTAASWKTDFVNVAGTAMSATNGVYVLPTTAAVFATASDITKVGGSAISNTNGVYVLPTTAATWKLASNTGVDIGDVDVLSLPAITGTVTANAGTDLNTSLLALETGGNLATIAGMVSGTHGQVDVLASALPTGAATDTLQTSGNASLTTLAGTVAGTEIQVDILSSTLPSGAATDASLTAMSAKLPATLGNSNMAGSISTSIASDDTLTVAIKTAVETIDNAIAGSEMQVDVISSALPSDAATETTLSAMNTKFTTGTDIGDVTINNVAGSPVYVDLGTGANFAKETGGNLATLVTRQPALGTSTMVGSSPVTIATDDTMIVALDTAVDSVVTNTGNISSDTSSLNLKIHSGSGTMADSVPVTISTDDTMITATNASLATIAGFTCNTGAIAGSVTANAGTNLNTSALALESGGNLEAAANNAALTAGSANNIDGKLPNLGNAAMTAAIPVTIASDDTLTSAANSSLTTIAGAVDSAHMQADIAGALPSGTNTIGKVGGGANVVIVGGASPLTVLAAHATGKYTFWRLTVTADSAGLVTLSDGLGTLYMGANSQVTIDLNPVGKEQTTAATAITATNAGGGNLSVIAVYHATP
jgi:hypothetical protein